MDFLRTVHLRIRVLPDKNNRVDVTKAEDLEKNKRNGQLGVIGCGLQAVERLAIGQVADNVKGGEVEPVGDIDGSSSDTYNT